MTGVQTLLFRSGQKRVVRTAENDAVRAGFQRLRQSMMCGFGKSGVVKLQGLDPVCPAGAGDDIDADVSGVSLNQTG